MAGNNELATLNYNDPFAITNTTYRQDFCNVNTSLENGGVGQGLAGKHVNSMIFSPQSDGYLNYDPKTGIDKNDPGFMANVLDTIADRGSFTWKSSSPSSSSSQSDGGGTELGFGYVYDIHANEDEKTKWYTNFGFGDVYDIYANKDEKKKTYTDFLMWAADNFDIVVGDWDITPERINDGVQFTMGIHEADLIMVRNVIPPGFSVDWSNWLLPFTYQVWFVVLITILLSAVVYQFLEWMGRKRENRSLRKWTMENVYNSFLGFTQNYSHEPSMLSTRFFGISFTLWTMLIGAAYTANLTQLLVTRSDSTFTLDSIEDAIDRQMKICVLTGSDFVEYTAPKYPAVLDLLVYRETVDEQYKALNFGECEVLMDYDHTFQLHQLHKEKNPNCYLKREGRAVATLKQGFATKFSTGIVCSDVVNEVFNYHLTNMLRDGTWERYWKEHVTSKATREPCDPSSNSNTGSSIRSRKLRFVTWFADTNSDDNSVNDQLDIKEMAGVFLVHLVGICIAVLLSALSFIERKYNVKHNSNKREISQQSTTSSDKNNDNESMEELPQHHQEQVVDITDRNSSLQQNDRLLLHHDDEVQHDTQITLQHKVNQLQSQMNTILSKLDSIEHVLLLNANNNNNNNINKHVDMTGSVRNDSKKVPEEQ